MIDADKGGVVSVAVRMADGKGSGVAWIVYTLGVAVSADDCARAAGFDRETRTAIVTWMAIRINPHVQKKRRWRFCRAIFSCVCSLLKRSKDSIVRVPIQACKRRTDS